MNLINEKCPLEVQDYQSEIFKSIKKSACAYNGIVCSPSAFVIQRVKSDVKNLFRKYLRSNDVLSNNIKMNSEMEKYVHPQTKTNPEDYCQISEYLSEISHQGHLTKSEIKIVYYLLKGYTPTEISRETNTTYSNVHKHILRLRAKLQFIKH